MKHQDLLLEPASTTPAVAAYNYFDLEAHRGAFSHLDLTAGLTNIADKTPPFVSGQPLTTDTATCDIIGRTDDVGFESKF